MEFNKWWTSTRDSGFLWAKATQHGPKEYAKFIWDAALASRPAAGVVESNNPCDYCDGFGCDCVKCNTHNRPFFRGKRMPKVANKEAGETIPFPSMDVIEPPIDGVNE